MNKQELQEKALSRERLDELEPPFTRKMQGSRRSKKWYNEAVWTAAAIFVEAAEQSDKFRTDFIKDVQKQETFEDSGLTVEVDAWRDTMERETPELYEMMRGIGMSGFQGGSAESVARDVLENEQKT